MKQGIRVGRWVVAGIVSSALVLTNFGLPYGVAAQGVYNNEEIANKALSYVDQPGANACNDAKKPGDSGGQCKPFVNCIVWMVSNGTQNLGGGYFGPFEQHGIRIAKEMELTRGDIVQIDEGGHTFIVVYRISEGKFRVVDSNHQYDEMVRTYDRTFTLSDTVRAYRLGQVVQPTSAWPGVTGLWFMGSDRLVTNQVMYTNQYLLSHDGRFVLALQSDGNLVLYSDNKALWSSVTAGTGASKLAMQPDGNLVLYTSDNRPVWNTQTQGIGNASFVVQSDGNLVLYRTNGSAAWSRGVSLPLSHTAYGSDRLTTGKVLRRNQYLKSADMRYTLLMQADGNLVLYAPGYKPLWSSNTAGTRASFVGMQPDGNVVLYGDDGRPYWNTQTPNTPGNTFIIQSDGNLVLYGTSPLWASATSSRLQ